MRRKGLCPGEMLENKPRLLLCAATVLALAPFATKAFCMDDPLFLWAARQIVAHPLNFYGFDVNWYGHQRPMSAVTENPPLASYYIALAASLFGWQELPLHLAFLAPAIAAVLGTYELAGRFCTRPVTAALCALTTPVFLVSSTNLMCDTMTLAWWVWTLVVWRRALDENRLRPFLIAGILAALCAASSRRWIPTRARVSMRRCGDRSRGRWARPRPKATDCSR